MNIFRNKETPNCSNCKWGKNEKTKLEMMGITTMIDVTLCKAQGNGNALQLYGSKACLKLYETCSLVEMAERMQTVKEGANG